MYMDSSVYRYGSYGSQLQRLIDRACDPSNFEPNIALQLEIADLVTSKKGNAPREAATAIVQYVNHRNQHVAMMALSLLDICVKNCGYPFHLQIATKEILNELVRRFPERPPVRPTLIQHKILELIEEWRSTLCVSSRHKEDLGFIRDMHRLLRFKGYVFPEIRLDSAAVLNPSENLKSADELEEEDRAAQQAKLQELIRKGTPHDLTEANRLVKILAGYDAASRTNYRAKAAEDLDKIRQKALLLNDMLDNMKSGETIGQSDVFSEMASAIKTALPKVQKMVQDEQHEDPEAVSSLLELNDLLNSTFERYRLEKIGRHDEAAKIAPTSPSRSSRPAPRSLIDLDGDSMAQSDAETADATDALSGLSFQSSSVFGEGGSIALDINQQSKIGLRQIGLTNLESLPSPPRKATPDLAAIKALNASYQSRSPPPLSSPSFNHSAFQQPSQLNRNNLARSHQSPTQSDQHDDFGSFKSAFESHHIPDVQLVSTQYINVSLSIQRNSPSEISCKATFSLAAANSRVEDVMLQVAVPKSLQLSMDPQSGRVLTDSSNKITQALHIEGISTETGEVKLRWRLTYRKEGTMHNEAGQSSISLTLS